MCQSFFSNQSAIVMYNFDENAPYLLASLAHEIHGWYFFFWMQKCSFKKCPVVSRPPKDQNDVITKGTHCKKRPTCTGRACSITGFVCSWFFPPQKECANESICHRWCPNCMMCSSSVRASACPCTRAIERFSRERQKPVRALANQNAASHLRQSDRLSVRHA